MFLWWTMRPFKDATQVKCSQKTALYLLKEAILTTRHLFGPKNEVSKRLKKINFYVCIIYVYVLSSNIDGHRAYLEHYNFFPGSKSKKSSKPSDQKKLVLIYPEV